MARGLYRVTAGRPQVFQLHPGAWHFAAGHIPKLELLGQDSPYARTSNGQFSIAVSDLQLRLPVHEAPGAAGTPATVTPPAAAVLLLGGAMHRSADLHDRQARRARLPPRLLRAWPRL